MIDGVLSMIAWIRRSLAPSACSIAARSVTSWQTPTRAATSPSTPTIGRPCESRTRSSPSGRTIRSLNTNGSRVSMLRSIVDQTRSRSSGLTRAMKSSAVPPNWPGSRP